MNFKNIQKLIENALGEKILMSSPNYICRFLAFHKKLPESHFNHLLVEELKKDKYKNGEEFNIE